MKKAFISIALISFPFFALAQGDITKCEPADYLTNGFNMGDYQKCEAALQQCPKNGPYPNISCTAKTVTAQTACAQLAAFANVADADVSQLKADSVGTNLTTISITYPADGKMRYYIISQNGCLINTDIDPRVLSSSLTQKYQNMSLLMMNDQPLAYAKETDGTQSLKAHLQITKDCAACETIGNAVIKFNFAADGVFKAVHLDSFNAVTKP